MNDDILKGNWHQLKGLVKEKWGELTEDEVTQVEGSTENLLGKLQERYGYSKEEAKQHFEDFINSHSKSQPK